MWASSMLSKLLTRRRTNMVAGVTANASTTWYSKAVAAKTNQLTVVACARDVCLAITLATTRVQALNRFLTRLATPLLAPPPKRKFIGRSIQTLQRWHQYQAHVKTHMWPRVGAYEGQIHLQLTERPMNIHLTQRTADNVMTQR